MTKNNKGSIGTEIIQSGFLQENMSKKNSLSDCKKLLFLSLIQH